MKKKLKIGIDFHGVLTSIPQFFVKFNRLAIQEGFEIYILSGGKKKDIKAYLASYGISYSYVWSMVDEFDKQNLVEYFADGSFKVDDELWNEAKAKFCEKNNIKLHIDDSIFYGKYFKTPYCLYNTHSKKCCGDGLSLDFNQSEETVLAIIKKYLS